MTTQETESAVVDFLSRCNVSFSVCLVGATERDDWECDEWRVTLKSGRADYTILYYTGTGLRKKGRFFDNMGRQQPCKPVAPSAASVLHSVLLAGSAIDQSFIYWCDDFGCDPDSRKALAAYEACCESGRKVRQLFTCTEREELSNLLQDF